MLAAPAGAVCWAVNGCHAAVSASVYSKQIFFPRHGRPRQRDEADVRAELREEIELRIEPVEHAVRRVRRIMAEECWPNPPGA